MNKTERNEFLEWHENKIKLNKIFCLKYELIEYCKIDVDILRIACIRFRNNLMEKTNVDPFNGPITIASTCMKVFRTMYLKPDTIALIPWNGYRRVDNQSIKAKKWLSWISHKNNVEIQTAENGRECRLPINIKVDGYCKSTNTVYEFLGCYWHACTTCFQIQSIFGEDRIRLGMRRDADKLRFERITDAGYCLVKIKECDFDKELGSNSEMRTYIEALNIEKNKLEIRDCYYGGRTNATKLYYKCKKDEKIRYYDVCSLYPYILKYYPMPIGVPKVLINDDLVGRTPENIEGIIRCKVLPPKKLYHPVLPMKLHNKLLFILCYTCALEKSKIACFHNDEQRSFVGTYVANELRLAMNVGYEILEMYEAWEYQLIKYDKNKNEVELFSQYIDFFLKMKTETSGYPNWVKNESDRNKYIENYHKNEGILLEKENIQNNPGFRTLANALLNYLYGKFGERSDKLKKMTVTSREDVVKIFSDETVEVQSMFEMSDDAVMFSYKHLKEADRNTGYVNVAIAAYTTAHARTVLYKYLNILKDSVLYFDTDSVIFVERKDTPHIATGDFLGDLTDELVEYGPNAYIESFVSGGPKNYAYEVKLNESEKVTVCKVKGIRLNYMNSQFINFQTIQRLLFSEQDEEEGGKIEISNNMILRQRNNIVYSMQRTYHYKINVTKRRRVNDPPYETYPFGHV